MRDANEIAELLLMLTRLITVNESEVFLRVEERHGTLSPQHHRRSSDLSLFLRNGNELIKAIGCIIDAMQTQHRTQIVLDRIAQTEFLQDAGQTPL